MEPKDDIALQKRFEEEAAKIKVDSYQKTASIGGWSGGGRTLWAIAAVGAAIGATIGVVAPFFPILAGVSSLTVAAGAIPASMAVFAATGLSMGFAGGLILGRITGSNAAVAAEQEKRMKEWTTRQLLAQNPAASIVEDAPPSPKPKKSFWQTVKDRYHTYINPRTGLFFTAMGALGGLIASAALVLTDGAIGGVMPEAVMKAITGLPPETFAVGAQGVSAAPLIAYTTGVMASFGAIFSLNMPKLASEITELTGKILSGKPLGREWGPQQPSKEQAIAKEMVVDAQAAEMPRMQKSFESYRDLIVKQAENTAELSRR